MPSYVIRGGMPLRGRTDIQGSKNSALPILAAAYLVNGRSEIHNCPSLTDISATVDILVMLGCTVERYGDTVIVDSTDAFGYEIPEELMREMRSSVIFLGALLGKTGKAVIYPPGGCDIGLRPIDLHLSSVRALGATVENEHGRLECSSDRGLLGTEITLAFPSVGATENIILAACLAKGTTVIVNAAREPEIADLQDFLNSAGARIRGGGESVITVEGVSRLYGTQHTVIPDRIVCATYLAAAAMTRGEIITGNVIPAHLAGVLPLFREAGCDIRCGSREIKLTAPARLRRIESILTQPYPGFPTDLQAPFTALCALAEGTSVITESIFECRFKHIPALIRMGAKIRTSGNTAVIEGVNELYGASVVSPDLRGGCSLMLAGLAARGVTTVSGTEHIDRGYENPAEVFNLLGGDVQRKDGEDDEEAR